MTDTQILDLFVKAAKKQKISLKTGGWGHSCLCNYSQGKSKRCNCGVSDMLTALKTYETFYPSKE